MTHKELDYILKKYSESELKHISSNERITVHRFEDNINHSNMTFGENIKNIFFQRHGRFTTHYFHTHDFFEIMFMYNGDGENNSDSCTSNLHEGDMCFVTPGAWHLPVVRGDNILLNFCVRTDWIIEFAKKLSSSNISDYLKNLNHSEKPKYLTIRSCGVDEIFDCVCRLAEAFADEHRDSKLEEECILQELIIKVANFCDDKIEYGNLFSTDKLFDKMMDMIGTDYRTLTLDKLAKQLNYSKAHLCRVIKKNTGTTFSDMVNKLRVSEACRMLQSENTPISEIAYSIGFSNIEYFNRTFRKYANLTPSAYRQKMSV